MGLTEVMNVVVNVDAICIGRPTAKDVDSLVRGAWSGSR